MTWMNTLSAMQWGILLSVPPLVVLLYFLKLRRAPVEVPSTYLWRKTIEDSHVNSLWQKLRQSLLLILQILFLLAVIFACLRPGWSSSQPLGERTILLIDNSASMNATDVSPSRIVAAKLKAKQLVESMNGNEVAMVIAFSDRADIRQGFTSDRNRLLDAINSIPTTSRTTDLNEAMRAAAGLANPGRVSFDGMNDIQVAEAMPATVHIYSDGGFAGLAEFDLGNLSVRYNPIGTATINNVGIEAFSILRNEEKAEEIQAYARVVSYSSEPVSMSASLYFENTLIDAVNVEIGPGKETGVSFDLSSVDTERGFFRMVLDREDQLAIDNTAYAAMRPSKPGNILLVSPGNKPLVTALETAAVTSIANVQIVLPSVLEDASEAQRLLNRTEYDLIIFDQCKPTEMPSANTLFIGSSPPDGKWKIGELTNNISLIDLDRTHPMMEFLELNSIIISEGRSVTPIEGGQVLIRANNGPAFAISPRGPFQDAVLGFPIVHQVGSKVELNTDWGKRRSFPLFVYACIQFLSGVTTQQSIASTLPGQSVTLTLPNRFKQFEITDPNGNSSIADRSPSGQFIYTATDSPGIYTIRSIQSSEKQPTASVEESEVASADTTSTSGKLASVKQIDAFAANLFSPRESNIKTLPELAIGGESVAGVAGPTPTRKEFWRWLLLAGFCLLSFEWYVYHRRQF